MHEWMSESAHVCVAEQTVRMGRFTLDSTLKQEYGIKEYA